MLEQGNAPTIPQIVFEIERPSTSRELFNSYPTIFADILPETNVSIIDIVDTFKEPIKIFIIGILYK